MSEQGLREELVTVARQLNTSGLNQGTSGNLSVRIPGGVLITPSSLSYEQMQPADLVALDLQGRPLQDNGRRPSSEWRLHVDVLAARADVQVVLHCHPIHGTALACHDRGIPPFHYMTAVAGVMTFAVRPTPPSEQGSCRRWRWKPWRSVRPVCWHAMVW